MKFSLRMEPGKQKNWKYIEVGIEENPVACKIISYESMLILMLWMLIRSIASILHSIANIL